MSGPANTYYLAPKFSYEGLPLLREECTCSRQMAPYLLGELSGGSCSLKVGEAVHSAIISGQSGGEGSTKDIEQC